MDETTKIQFGCSSCGGQDAILARKGKVSVSRVIEKLDACFQKNDMVGAGEVLKFWHNEAVALRDFTAELSIVNEELGYFRKIGDAEKGIEAVNRSLALLKELNQDSTVSGGTILLNAATTLKAFGRPEDALPLYEKTLDIYKQYLDKNDMRFGGFYNNFALTLVDLNRFDEAEDYYKRAIMIMKQTIKGLPDCAVTYVNMAHLWETKNPEEEDKIFYCLQEAKEILERDDIIKDGYYAYVCSKCAPSYDYFGYFIYAKELNERAKEIYERS